MGYHRHSVSWGLERKKADDIGRNVAEGSIARVDTYVGTW